MNKIRQQLLKSHDVRASNVQKTADEVIADAKRTRALKFLTPLKAVRGNDVTVAKQRKALAILCATIVS